MFEKQTNKSHVIFSPLEGILMKGDKPLSNTKITRRLSWNGNEGGLVEEFTTDDRGFFFLPLHEEDLSLNMLNQFVAKAEITINGGELLWYASKLFPELYAETGDPVTELVCDISAEEIPVFIGDSVVPNILTKCRWKGMPSS